MAAKAAARCGAGLVDIALPKSIYPIVSSQIAEPIYTLLDYDASGLILPDSKTALIHALQSSSACLIGCGLGMSPGIADLVYEMITKSEVPLILDADGINAVAANIDILKTAKVPVILTPHPGEMSRLLHTTAADVQKHRLEYAGNFAKQYGVVLVLKGSGTIIAAPDGRLYVNPTGNAGMAKGGSGDVLAGMIASFAAQSVEPLFAAVCGVYLHGLAGDRCADKLSQRAMLPTDMIQELPRLFLEFEQ